MTYRSVSIAPLANSATSDHSGGPAVIDDIADPADGQKKSNKSKKTLDTSAQSGIMDT